jgi:PIN domain nuclease of toxin-antitoxin system
VRLLLDTNALLWLLAGDPRLGAQARHEVEAAAELVVSAASLWEIAIKVSIGRLAALPGLPAVLAEAGVRRLGIEDEHLRRLESLPWHHRDPFDRLLIAQAQAEALTVLTADPAFGDYAVPARDARR